MPLMPRVKKKKGATAGQMGGRGFTEGRWMSSHWSNAGVPWQPRLRRCRVELHGPVAMQQGFGREEARRRRGSKRKQRYAKHLPPLSAPRARPRTRCRIQVRGRGVPTGSKWSERGERSKKMVGEFGATGVGVFWAAKRASPDEGRAGENTKA